MHGLRSQCPFDLACAVLKCVAGGITHNVTGTSDVIAYIIKDGAHHLDLRTSDPAGEARSVRVHARDGIGVPHCGGCDVGKRSHCVVAVGEDVFITPNRVPPRPCRADPPSVIEARSIEATAITRWCNAFWEKRGIDRRI